MTLGALSYVSYQYTLYTVLLLAYLDDAKAVPYRSDSVLGCHVYCSRRRTILHLSTSGLLSRLAAAHAARHDGARTAEVPTVRGGLRLHAAGPVSVCGECHAPASQQQHAAA